MFERTTRNFSFDLMIMIIEFVSLFIIFKKWSRAITIGLFRINKTRIQMYSVVELRWVHLQVLSSRLKETEKVGNCMACLTQFSQTEIKILKIQPKLNWESFVVLLKHVKMEMVKISSLLPDKWWEKILLIGSKSLIFVPKCICSAFRI